MRRAAAAIILSLVGCLTASNVPQTLQGTFSVTSTPESSPLDNSDVVKGIHLSLLDQGVSDAAVTCTVKEGKEGNTVTNTSVAFSLKASATIMTKAVSVIKSKPFEKELLHQLKSSTPGVLGITVIKEGFPQDLPSQHHHSGISPQVVVVGLGVLFCVGFGVMVCSLQKKTTKPARAGQQTPGEHVDDEDHKTEPLIRRKSET